MKRLPIRMRVAAAFAVAMAVVLVLTGLFLYARVGSHFSTALDHQLEVRANDLTTLVTEPGTPLPALRNNRFVEPGESYAQLLDSRGRVLDATPPLGRASLLTAAELRTARKETVIADRETVPGLDEPSRLLATPVTRDGRRLVLIVGVTREGRAEALRSLRYELLIAGPIALVLATLAGYALAGLSLRPVDAMRRRAAEISAATPGERLPVPETGDELERLGETLNEMLARLEAALERERDFVADAGHELRTPLALLRTELELALRHADSREQLREAVRSSSEEVDRLAQLAEDLLLIARSDQGRLPLRLETLEASELLASTGRRFEWRAHEARRPLRATAAPGLRVEGDRIRLEQALGNLVDNAFRHGGGEIRLSAVAANGFVELHVTDEGSGFEPEFLGRAFERFARADPARARGGSGLGLSIVRMIATAHGGTAHVASSDRGGADVWVSLPQSSLPAPEEPAADQAHEARVSA
jgi:two-component system OmpR family sensor kinase